MSLCLMGSPNLYDDIKKEKCKMASTYFLENLFSTLESNLLEWTSW